MENYYLSSTDIYTLLQDKGVEYLYHANTVSTSMTFIKENALLSRGYVEENHLVQTPQKSDKEDKLYDVWNHVFLDATDLHTRYSQANHYGPVTFRIKLELLKNPDLPNMIITKSNPMYWKPSTPMDSRFYNSLDDVKNDYMTGKKLDSYVMFTFKDCGKIISLADYVVAIGIDRPEILIDLRKGGQKNVGEYTFEKIKKCLKDTGLEDIPLGFRHPEGRKFCRCNLDYTYLYNFKYPEFLKRFYPQE